jgi:hypothetical protein
MSQQRKIPMHPFGLAVDVSNNNEHSLSGSYTLGLAHAARNGERFDNSSAHLPRKRASTTLFIGSPPSVQWWCAVCDTPIWVPKKSPVALPRICIRCTGPDTVRVTDPT